MKVGLLHLAPKLAMLYSSVEYINPRRYDNEGLIEVFDDAFSKTGNLTRSVLVKLKWMHSDGRLASSDPTISTSL